MRIAFLNLFLGIILIYLGLQQNGYGLLMSWLGFSFLLSGLAYSGLLKANMYAKNTAGQIPLIFIFLNFPFFVYVWTLWHLIQKLIKENPYDQVNENIIIGRRLLKNECPKNIVNYVDLTIEFNEPQSLVEQSNYIFLPILDGSVPDSEALENSFNQLADGLTYIHCAQGHGRTGLYAALLLLRQGEVKTPEQALILLKEYRPALELNQKQKQFLQDYTQE